MTDEATLEPRPTGLAPVTPGWFVVDVRKAAWMTNETFGAACIFEADEAPFGQVGYTIGVLQPGQPSGMYHRETAQEDFLVLSGECLLIAEDEERPLRAWDFVHCPPGTNHVIIGAGDRPSLVLAVGARSTRGEIVYPVSPVAQRLGAGLDHETSDPAEAYEHVSRPRPTRYRDGWLQA